MRAIATRLELNALGAGTFDVSSSHIEALLVEWHVECTRTRPFNVPIVVLEFRLVNSASSVKFRLCPGDIVRHEVT